MEVPHNKTEMPLSHYRGMLAEADPAALATKSGVAYDEQTACFNLTVLGEPFALSFPAGIVSRVSDGKEASSDLTILALRLVLEGTLAPSTGKFIPYAQIPWGTTYLAAFTGRCLTRLAYMFSCANAFCLAAEKIGGQPIESTADGAYQLEFVPGVFIQVLFWEGDEEFQPRTQMLFSDNVSLAFTAEDVAVLGGVVDTALKRGVVL